MKYDDKKVKRKEGRDQIISASFDQFVQSGHVEREMIENTILGR